MEITARQFRVATAAAGLAALSAIWGSKPLQITFDNPDDPAQTTLASDPPAFNPNRPLITEPPAMTTVGALAAFEAAVNKRTEEQTPAQTAVEYIVQPGDTLSEIVQAYYPDMHCYLAMEQVADFNGLTHPFVIHPGDEIMLIPCEYKYPYNRYPPALPHAPTPTVNAP